MTDGKLLELLGKDERRGFEALVKEYAPYIAAIVRSRLPRLDADKRSDAAGDIFLEILKALRAGQEPPRSLKAFISVIAVRYCIGVYRKNRSEAAALPLDELPEQPFTDSGYERAELIAALKALGEPDCEIFIRKYFLSQTSSEIGAALGLKPNTVDQKISRGLKKLREGMKE